MNALVCAAVQSHHSVKRLGMRARGKVTMVSKVFLAVTIAVHTMCENLAARQQKTLMQISGL
jgi:hypothetical protein